VLGEAEEKDLSEVGNAWVEWRSKKTDLSDIPELKEGNARLGEIGTNLPGMREKVKDL
jgi:hypothetical protein